MKVSKSEEQKYLALEIQCTTLKINYSINSKEEGKQL